MDLKDKVIFITGAAQGIGKGYAQASMERGAKLFFVDLNATNGEATLKEFSERFGAANVRFAQLDVTDHDKFTAVFQQAVAEFGQVDVMVNNAGLLNESRWNDMVLINVGALFLGTNLAVEHMRKDKGGRGGRIINISSVAGLLDVPFMPAYCGTKHAVRAFTSSLAKHLSGPEIGVDLGVLCPDAVNTDMITQLDDNKALNFSAVKHLLTPDKTLEVAHIVAAFLELLQLEKMNGCQLHVSLAGNEYCKTEKITVEKPGL